MAGRYYEELEARDGASPPAVPDRDRNRQRPVLLADHEPTASAPGCRVRAPQPFRPAGGQRALQLEPDDGADGHDTTLGTTGGNLGFERIEFTQAGVHRRHDQRRDRSDLHAHRPAGRSSASSSSSIALTTRTTRSSCSCRRVGSDLPTSPLRKPTVSERPVRSWLYVPADDPRKIAKAAASEADVAILDLEDGCAADRKVQGAPSGARRAGRPRLRAIPALRAHQRLRFASLARRPRGRPADAADGLVIGQGVRPDRGQRRGRLVRAQRGAGDQPPDLAPIVTEEVTGPVRRRATITADPLVGTVLWGTEDLSASLGAWRSGRGGELIDVFRSCAASPC